MPAAGDLKACPFLTISEPYEGTLSDGDKSYCDEPEDKGKSGWIEIYDSGNPGCGVFYDCCARVIFIACAETLCMFFNSSSRTCNFGGGGGGGEELLEEALYVQEWLFRKPMSKYGKRTGLKYGHDWVMSDPPPALQNIPPQEVKI